RLPAVIYVFDQRRAKSARLTPPWAPDPRAVPGYVVITVPPGPTPAVVFIPIPRFVIPPGPVNHRPFVFISPEITGGITGLDTVFIGVEHADERGVIDGRTGRDGVNL